MPSSSTPDRYAVAGNPVAHSRSPHIHQLFAQQTGQAIDYGRLLCPLDAFTVEVQAFAASGAKGCNVTVPFKFEAFELAARRTPRAELAQAANTLRFDAEADGGWLADNTDGVGLVRDITVNAGVSLAGRRVLLLGAGGASAGVLGPLIEARPAEIVMANRTIEKAQAIVDRHAVWAAQHGVRLHARSLTDAGVGYDVFINGTAASLAGCGVPVGAEVLSPGCGHDVWRSRPAVSGLGSSPRRACPRWAGHAGGTGRRELRPVAWRAPGHRAGVGATAR
jgi:shikimate dehydrogenase